MADPMTVHLNSRFSAVLALAEVLGSHGSELSVAVPASVPLDVLSAVMRAGCAPALLDVDPDTLCILPSALEDLLTNVPSANWIVFSCLPPGVTPCAQLTQLTRTKDIPHILVHDAPSSEVPLSTDYIAQVYGTSTAPFPYGMVSTCYTDIMTDVLSVSTGALGLYSYFTPVMNQAVYDQLSNACGGDPSKPFELACKLASERGWELTSTSPGYGGGTTVRVLPGFLPPNSEWIQRALDCTYLRDEVKNRFEDEVPDYPGVDLAHTQYFVIPDDVEVINKLLLETP